MKPITSALVFALALSAPAALAQTTKPDVSGAPSAQNSGAGIAGQPGNKSGPAAKPARPSAPARRRTSRIRWFNSRTLRISRACRATRADRRLRSPIASDVGAAVEFRAVPAS